VKLLVLAQLPPPVHGQSVMVRTLVTGLPAHGVTVHHVDLRLSRDAADIGRWRWGKLAAVLDACLHAVVARFRHGCDTLYYVPAPGKRGALYRDWVVMLLCRPFFRRLVLHWHAAGLGAWLRARATAPERRLTRWLLGRADLAIVLGEALRDDAEALAARRIAVVPNGIPDPCPGWVRPALRPPGPHLALFLGLVVPDKGVLEAIDGVNAANAGSPAPRWHLVIAGLAPDPRFAATVQARAAHSAGTIRVVGFAGPAEKHRLLTAASALLFPTRYEAETQGLVVAEALAYDLPVVVTRWRAVAEHVPATTARIVPPRDPAAIAAALQGIAATPPPAGESRRFFASRLLAGAHLTSVAAELAGLAAPSRR